jgi:xanthine dehydrogenase accessory factor
MPPLSDELDHLLSSLLDWRQAGHGCALATVVSTWGSAPRQPGAHLAIRDDGLFLGSVSGGCVEGDVIVTAQSVIASGTSCVRDYGVSNADAWEVGLACGGQIRVLIQPIAPAAFPEPLVRQLRDARRAGQTIIVATDLETGYSQPERTSNAEAFRHPYAPPLRLALIGAVHISQALVPMAQLAGYAPIVIDPRTAFARSDRFPDTRLDDRWPDEALSDWQPNAASAIVALTHDPKLDDPALIAALRSDAFYIAALGSRKTHGQRLERLAAQGFTSDQLARIHGPAGLAIGAANPVEIAISVMAEMTAVLRGRRD